MIDEITKIFADYAPYISLLTFLTGLLIGNWQAIGRDRRKEMLEVSTPIHERLLEQLNGQDHLTFRKTVDSNDLLRLRSRYMYRTLADRIRGIGYDKAVEAYHSTHKAATYQDQQTGQILWHDLTAYRLAIKRLLRYAPIK